MSKLRSVNLLPNISPGPIPEKANADLANGNSIHYDNLVNYLPEVLDSAKQNFERFFDLRPGTSTQEQIDRSSLGVTGWSSADVRENQSVAQDRAHREAHDERGGGGCCAFGAQKVHGATEQNAQSPS